MTTAATLRPVTTDDDLAAFAAIVNAVTPESPTSVEEQRWADETYPGGLSILAEQDGRVVGAASVGRIFMYEADHPRFWVSLVVDAAARRQGIGSALLAAASDHAAAAGKTGFETRAFDDRPGGIEFLEHRGFREIERARMVRLDLGGLARPSVALPAGLRMTTLAERPDLVPGVHAVALETFGDIPGDGDPMVAGDLAEFRARDVHRPGIPIDGFFVALDEGDDTVVGYASLQLVPGSTSMAWHDMTAVLRAWRGRGVAGALKRATIAWAIEHDLSALETGNDVDNAPMRAVNARLGYQPLPDELMMRGPLYRPGAVTAGGAASDGTSADDRAS